MRHHGQSENNVLIVAKWKMETGDDGGQTVKPLPSNDLRKQAEGRHRKL